MKRLKKEQIEKIPQEVELKGVDQVAKEMEVSKQNIYYWVNAFKKRGVEVKIKSRENMLDEILKDSIKNITNGTQPIV